MDPCECLFAADAATRQAVSHPVSAICMPLEEVLFYVRAMYRPTGLRSVQSFNLHGSRWGAMNIGWRYL